MLMSFMLDFLVNLVGDSRTVYLKVKLHQFFLLFYSVIARQAEVTCAVSDSLVIPKGMIVQANVWAIHHDPEIWGPDPDKFNPER